MPFFLATLLIPFIIGIIRIRVIHKSYYWFLFYILISVFGELSHTFIKGILFKNIIQNIHSIVANVALLILLFKWGYLNNNVITKKLLIVVFILLPTINFIVQNNHEIKIQWASLACTFIWILLGIQYISTRLNKVNNIKIKASKILILVPLMSTIIYFTILQILMGFLYNASTALLFTDLYTVVIFLQIASNLFFGIALILAPKKENFLTLPAKD